MTLRTPGKTKSLRERIGLSMGLACLLGSLAASGGAGTAAAQAPTPSPSPPPAPAAPPTAPGPGPGPGAAAIPGQAGDALSVDPTAGLEGLLPLAPGEYTYDPSGRRDPFASILREGPTGADNVDLPPLQRLSLTELNLMGILWGGFGYSAMVQAPDGKGYTVRVGTRIGPNNGVVTAITENTMTVEERFTDVYGKKQIREYVKRLHEKESAQ